jgi:hypothetical protein
MGCKVTQPPICVRLFAAPRHLPAKVLALVGGLPLPRTLGVLFAADPVPLPLHIFALAVQLRPLLGDPSVLERGLLPPLLRIDCPNDARCGALARQIFIVAQAGGGGWGFGGLCCE